MDIKHYIDNKLLPESQNDFSTYGIYGQSLTKILTYRVSRYLVFV